MRATWKASVCPPGTLRHVGMSPGLRTVISVVQMRDSHGASTDVATLACALNLDHEVARIMLDQAEDMGWLRQVAE